LKQLGVEAIDLYQIHWPAWSGNPESASPASVEEAVGALAKFQAQGKIRHIGVSNFNAQQMQARSKCGSDCFPPTAVLASDERD
jgi:diketogulonate reductase-like aldo/keto reductase